MKLSLKVLTATATVLLAASFNRPVMAAAVNTIATWTGPFSGPSPAQESWTIGTNWSSSPDHPSGEGAGGIFLLDGSTTNHLRVNVTPTTGESQVTVGSLAFNNSSAFTVTLIGGTTIPLRLNAAGDGSATVTVTGNSTSSGAPNTITAKTIFDDSVIATVAPTSSTSQSGALDWTGEVQSGVGGFTKLGLGLMTFSSNEKLYTGPTVFDTDSGRTRISVAGRPSMTSSVTVESGSQLTLITANSTYTFGASSSVPLNLNGAGPTSGQHAPFPGVIRNNTDLVTTIANNVNLQSTSTIHVQGTATGSTTLSGNVSGVGGLIAGANPHDANLGQLVLSGTNSYTGGSISRAGNLVAGASSVTAFGTGNVSVESANLIFSGSAAKVSILGGASNAIDDLATLLLAGGNAVGVADDGFIDLGSGINETVGGLVLGGSAQSLAGTYGSTASGAQFAFDEFFSGLGLITLAPAAGQPGDYNGDGKVNAADYVAWRKLPGTFGGDPGGYNTWRENYGEGGPGGGGSAAVPEPSTLSLAGLFIAFFATNAARRRFAD